MDTKRAKHDADGADFNSLAFAASEPNIWPSSTSNSNDAHFGLGA
jgi:hypothetical protein